MATTTLYRNVLLLVSCPLDGNISWSKMAAITVGIIERLSNVPD